MGRSSWSYFNLLIWKNFLIKFRHKKQFIIEIIIPVIFCCILLIVRYLIVPTKKDTPTIYEPIEADNLTVLMMHLPPNIVKEWKIDYTPNETLIGELVTNAAKTMGFQAEGFQNPETLENHMITNKTFAGVVFDPETITNGRLSKTLNYTIRFPGALRTSDRFSEFATWMTKNRFPMLHHQGPRNRNLSDGGIPPGYIREGFIAVQNAITSTYIQMVSNYSVPLPKINLRRFPYPAYVDDPLLMALENLAAVIMILSFVYPCTQAIKYVTVEKETQLKEAMKIMGLTNLLNWSAWFVTLWSCLVFTVLIIVLVVKVPWFQNFTASVLPKTDWFLLIVFLSVYAASTITFCFMMSAFFRTANVAAAVGGLMYFLFYIPYSFSISNFVDMGLGTKLTLSLFLNTALGFGFKLIVKWESVNIGAQWNNLFKTVTIEDNVCVANIMGMLLLDGVIYMLIAWYLERVLPGTYGVPDKWYFPFTRDFWCPRHSEYVDDSDFEISDPERFEPEDTHQNVGIRIINLGKKFRSKIAVDRLNLNIYEGQITVLLGHNGAGKTTTISMITGLTPPTTGTVLVNGLDIRTEMSEIRRTFGYCPQHNILFPELTVTEHIIFYCRLKGFKKDRIKAEVAKYLKLLNFEGKRNAQAGTLSGGMKRKLSVCVALCGDSKVVLCDEPSSGMDPAARRSLWDLLLAEKNGRTILLTTHFMDEADVLGDRIAIMSGGNLVCSGSPFFLKKKFGAGYQLICSKGSKCKTQKVTALLRKFIPEIEVKSDVGRELSYQLPEKHVKIFEPMLKELESSFVELDLNGYGISMTTLEDVFMRTGSDTMELLESAIVSNNLTQDSSLVTSIELSEKDSSAIIGAATTNIHLVGRVKRLQYQWYAMFLKKLYIFSRKWYLFLIQILVPLIFLALSVYVAKSMNLESPLPPIVITSRIYGHTTVLMESTGRDSTGSQRFTESYKREILTNPHSQFTQIKKPMVEELLNLEKSSRLTVDTRYMAAATFSDDGITAWFNNEVLHSAPLTLNLVFNALARFAIGDDSRIQLTNHPLPYDTDFRIQRLRNTGGLGFQLSLNMAFAMSFVSAMFIMFPISERDSRAKLLQFVSGVRIFTFWLSHFIWDFIVYVFISLLVVALMFSFQQAGFATLHEVGRTFLVFIMYGFTSLPFTYLVSFLYNEPAAGLSRLAIYNVFTGNALFLIVFVLNLPGIGLSKTANLLQEVFMIFPSYALAQGLANQATLASTNNICESAEAILGIEMKLICQVIAPECCDMKPFGLKNPGIGKILLYMVTFGIFFLVLLFTLEYLQRSVIKKLTNRLLRPSLDKYLEEEDIDDDVKRERKKVGEMMSSDISEHNLVMSQVTKFYGNFLAVNRISLAIERGECFGMLGINGAGKTSTFKMLTGDEHTSYGNIWVQGYNTKTKMNTIYEMIGYCPQFDALFMDLTGRETLRIYSLLRGVPFFYISPMIERLAKDLAFYKHLDKPVAAYSGGNRRKLSTAVAILGQPHVIYLDEPTTGIDPASRRKLWDMICSVRDLGKGVVLTSHSMEECEALCTRITIMVNGQLSCLGSTQHLKNKFSKGISLTLKLREMEHLNGYLNQSQNVTLYGQLVSNGKGKQHPLFMRRSFNELSRPELALGKYGRDVYNFIIQQFPGAVLRDFHKNLLTFDIPQHIMPYSRIFGLMEANKDGLHIEDYSLSQTTLEQVFLSFAQKQTEDDNTKRKATKY